MAPLGRPMCTNDIMVIFVRHCIDLRRNLVQAIPPDSEHACRLQNSRDFGVKLCVVKPMICLRNGDEIAAICRKPRLFGNLNSVFDIGRFLAAAICEALPSDA